MKPKKYSKPIVVRLDPKDADTLSEIAANECRTVASIFRQAVKEYIVKRIGSMNP
jgi:predicted transcriptional regulator